MAQSFQPCALPTELLKHLKFNIVNIKHGVHNLQLNLKKKKKKEKKKKKIK